MTAKTSPTMHHYATWKDYILLTKPGIIGGNLIAAIGAFLVVRTESGIDLVALLGLILGTVFIIAAACVLNNYYDRDIDAQMRRTAKRPSVTGVIPPKIGFAYAAVLFILGVVILLLLTNLSTVGVGVLGAFFYAVVYSYAKRKTSWATFIGAFPGATPPLAGYVAASGQLDMGAFLVFAIMFAWQMPHFYAIAIFRQKEYDAARLPILPTVKGLARTVWEMRIYALLFLLLCYIFARTGYGGFMFGIGMTALSAYWLIPLFSPHWRSQTDYTSRTVFKRSLFVLVGLSFFWAMNTVLL